MNEYAEIIATCFPALLGYCTSDIVKARQIFDFLGPFEVIGDKFRRVMSIAIHDKFDFTGVIFTWPRFLPEAARLFSNLLLGLLCDDYFCKSFAKSVCENYSSLFHIELSTLNPVLRPLTSICFHAFEFILSSSEILEQYGRSICNVFSTYIEFITSLVSNDQSHPIIVTSLQRNYFEDFGMLLSSNEFAEILKEQEDELYIIVESLAALDGVPCLSSVSPPDSTQIQGWMQFSQNLIDAAAGLIDMDADSQLFFDELSQIVTFSSFSNASLMNDGIEFSPFLPLHYIAFMHLIKHNSDIKTKWGEISAVTEKDPDDLAYEASYLPIKCCLVTNLSPYFSLNSQESEFSYYINLQQGCITGIGYFAATQVCLGVCDAKERIVNQIAAFSGALDYCMRLLINWDVVFVFLHFIACVVFDRTLFNGDIIRQRLIWALHDCHMNGEQIMGELGDIDDCIDLTELLDELCDKVKIERTIVYELKSHIKCFPFNPFSCPDDLIDWDFDSIVYPEDEPASLKLKDALSCPSFTSVCYCILSDYFNNCEMGDEIVLLVFSLFSAVVTDFEPSDHPTIVAETFSDLLHSVPLSFIDFIQTEFVFENRAPMSILQMAEMSQLSAPFLRKLNHEPPPRPIPSDVKIRILTEFYERRVQYFDKSQRPILDSACSVCRSEEKGFTLIPVLTYPFFIDGKTYTNLFSCIHPIHNSCKSKTYKCGLDNFKFNILVPVIPEKFTLSIASPEITDAVFTFVAKLDIRFPFRAAVRILSDFITLLEIRFRINPFAIDDYFVLKTADCFFSSIWYFAHIFNADLTDTTGLSELEILVGSIAISDSPREEFTIRFNKIFSSITTEMDTFIRQSFIFADLCLDIELPDWNELYPDINVLINNFHLIAPVQSPIKYYTLIDLPDSFLEFTSCIESRSYSVLALNLINGDFTDIGTNDYRDLIDEEFGGTLSLFIVLTGEYASNIVVLSNTFDTVAFLGSPYIDDFGMEDIGLKKGKMLYLNGDRLDYILFQYLSGIYIMSMTPLTAINNINR